MKKIFGILGITFLVLAGVQYARADEALKTECTRGAFGDMRAELEAGGVTISEVPQGIVDALVAAKGNPPDTPDGFKVLRLDNGGNSQLVFTDPNGCVTYSMPVRPSEVYDRFLGINRV